MKKLISALWLASSLTAGAAWAQPYAPNEAGVTMGHWHLNSRDVEANKKIFLGMGGAEGGPGPLQRVTFPGVVVILNQQAGAPPATGGTIGSVVNHVGFIVQNVQESVAKWKAAGVPVEPGNNGRLDQAYVTTPDGLRIEILENKNQNVPIRHEHVHFFLPEAAIAQSQAWYIKKLEANGVKLDRPYSKNEQSGVALAFITDPWGTYIELNERPKPVYLP